MAVASVPAHAQPDPLGSWHDGAAKARIVALVKAATEPGGKDFVPAAGRIAVFDNDGTLWSEQPFKAALEGDMKVLAASGEHGLVELVMASHAGNTADEFAQIARDRVASARHPQSNRLYTELTYRPMRELLDFLRAHGVVTYTVSGGGIEFLRVVSEELYGVPPQQVIGSSIRTKYELRDGKRVIVGLPELGFVDDKAGKPVGIHNSIGKRPIAAFGNADGDFEMLQ
jgi:hypothetical protein